MNLSNIKKSIRTIETDVSTLKGKVQLLENQYDENVAKLDDLKELVDINAKGIELLNHIQTITKEKIKEVFENIVTKALQFVYQDNGYKFELDFGRRGNSPKLTFRLKTPDMQEPHDIVKTRAGGSKDIIVLALRFVLLEISKIPGFVFLDEPFKRLDNEETTQKAIEFIKELQKESSRQIFIITHKQAVVDSVNNPIIIK